MSDDPDNPGSFWRLLCHLIDEMSWKMVCAMGLISFFFFYGATNAAIKLAGRNLATYETQPGPIIALGSAVLVVIVATAIKLRPRS